MSKSVGEYQLREKIGKGSYADVYKGIHKPTGRVYAIKAISKEILTEQKLIVGLESEIKIMREFAHENIVQLHEYFSSEKNFYLVLELCKGGDLSKYIRKNRRLSENISYSFLFQLANGLSYLHENNFIHRDLKPANVLLSEFSDRAVLKLADFGFARHLAVASLAQTRCGTPLYMAPEILESRDYDTKADVWSIGCIFYEMLVGTCPFKGTNEIDLLFNIKTKDLHVPKDVELSKHSREILVKLLERQSSRRASLSQLIAISHKITREKLLVPGPDVKPELMKTRLSEGSASGGAYKEMSSSQMNQDLAYNRRPASERRRNTVSGAEMGFTRTPQKQHPYGGPLNPGTPPNTASPLNLSMNLVKAFAYVFSPATAPPPPVGMSGSRSARESYQSAEQRRPVPPDRSRSQLHQQGRSVSLDGAASNYFNDFRGNNDFQEEKGRNGGTGQYEPRSCPETFGAEGSNREFETSAGSSLKGEVRPDWFKDPGGPNSLQSGKEESSATSSGMTVDGDFIMIENSSARGGEGSSGKSSSTTHQPFREERPSPSAPEISVGALVPRAQTTHLSQSGGIATSVFYSSTARRCSVYSSAVSAINTLADSHVREALTAGSPHEKNTGLGTAMVSMEIVKDKSPVYKFLTACTLYLHALELLKSLMRSMEAWETFPVSNPLNSSINQLRQDISVVFNQLIERAEYCQKYFHSYEGRVSSATSVPSAQSIMLKAALQKESDASMQELLGNLNRASKLYGSAQELVEGVALTASEQEEQRRLQACSQALRVKSDACKTRLQQITGDS